MNLDAFDEKIIPNACGFRNLGATCYFNSLLQSLLSCSSLTRIMISNRNNPRYEKNSVAMAYIYVLDRVFIIDDRHSDTLPLSELSPLFWNSIINYLKEKGSHQYFGKGQEDSHESFKMLMECWEDLKEVVWLFSHKDHISIYCTACRQWNNDQDEDINNKNPFNETLQFFEVPKGFKSEIPREIERMIKPSDAENGTLEGFLTRQITFMDEGYRCSCYAPHACIIDSSNNSYRLKPEACACVCDDEKKRRANNCICTNDELKGNNGKCLDTCNCVCKCNRKDGLCNYKCNSKLVKIKTVTMKIIPNILVLMCPSKVAGKYDENFPDTLIFRTKKSRAKYRIVSQIIHSGGASGGHYWAHAARNTPDGLKWFELDDTHTTKINGFKSSAGTYVLFYHFDELLADE